MILLRTLLLLTLLLPVRAWASPPVRWQICEDGQAAVCHPVNPERLTLAGPIVTLVGIVAVPQPIDGVRRSLAIDLDAMASADVRWNGTLIGRNGVVGADRSSEVAGRYSASIPIPAALVHAGRNQLLIRLSAHHLWLPVSQPIHRIELGSPVDADAYTLRHYLPTLAILALPAMALAILLVLLTSGRIGRSALLPVAILGIVLLQGGLETSKLVLSYTYPWHLARLVTLTGLTGIVAVILSALSASVFAPAALRWVAGLSVTALSIAFLFVAGPDQQALALFQTGLALVALTTLRAVRRHDRKAAGVLVITLVVLAWSNLAGPDFLDSSYYIVAAIGAVAVCLLATARRDAIVAPNASPIAPAEALVTIRDGARQHVVLPSQITHLKANDDYCSIYFVDGRHVMVTMPLKDLLALLPADFVRVHRSHAVNATRIASVGPGPNRTRIAVLRDGATLPVGRTFATQLLHALER